MNLTEKTTTSLPRLMTDWLRPTLTGRDFFDIGTDWFTSRLGANLPSVNMKETLKEYMLELAAPGLERKDFNIEIENGVLTISAENKEEKEEKENGYFRKEFMYNTFSRSFTLPENIKENAIDAKYDKGILKVTLPKVKETPVKPVHKIAVG